MIAILTIIEVIFLIGFLIFIHEGGHYIAAKLSKVKVKEFAIGFGPVLYRKQGKETLFTLRAIPFGGFNDLLGESERVPDKDAFCNAKLSKRIFIILAGDLVNIIFGLIVYFIVALVFAQIPSTTIAELMQECKIVESGVEVGDTIIKLDDVEINEKTDIDHFMLDTKGQDVRMTVRKPNGDIKEYLVHQTEYNGTYILGVSAAPKDAVPFDQRVNYATESTVVFVYKTYVSVKNMFTGNFRMEQVMGPIGIGELVAESNTLDNFVYLLSVISISLGVTNLLPLPALDGGKFVLLVVEGIRRKPLKEETELAINSLGFVFLISLAIFVATNDLVRILRGVLG